MNRYSLDIFRAPVMHNQGDLIKYKKYAEDMRDKNLQISSLESSLKVKGYQYEHALNVANESQHDLRKVNLCANVLCCMVVVLIVVEAWLISGML